MDLSGLTDADLKAIQSGNMTGVSDAGLAALSKQQAAPTAPAAPQKSMFHQILDYALANNPISNALHTARAVGDVGASAITGAAARIPAGIAGLANEGTNALGLTNNEPADTVKGVEHALTLPPQTPEGQGLSGAMGAAGHALTHNPVADKVGEAVDATGHGPLIRTAVPAVADAVASTVPLFRALAPAAGALDISALSPEAQAEFHARTPGAPIPPDAPPGIGKPNDTTPLATARGAGFPTTASNIALRNPTQQPGLIEQARELVQGGNGTLTASNNAKATARATQLAGQQMGLGDDVTKITVPDLKTAKAAPGAAYDLTGQALGDFKPTSNMSNLLKDAATDNGVDSSSAARTAANRVLSQIDPETGLYQGGGPRLVKDISSLRESANTRPIANILEDEMDRQAQNSLTPGLTKNYRDARRQFAQIYTVQDALQGGQVDPQAIGDVHQANPNLLTGNLRLIGTAAQELPADVKLPTQADGVVDSLVRGGKSILGAPARALLNTDAAQNRFGPVADATGRSYFPTFGERPVSAADPLKLALAPGKAPGRVLPSQGGPHNGAQGELDVPPNARPLIDLNAPEGAVGRPTPVQGSLAVPEGPESISGATPASRGANDLIRPLGEAFQPHQPDLFPPNNVSKPKGDAPKVSKPSGISDSDWKLLLSLGLGE